MDQQISIFEDFDFENSDILVEVSPQREITLKELDILFLKLKHDIKNKDVQREIIEKIKEFTNVTKVSFNIKHDYFNAAIIPLYKDNIPHQFKFWNILKDLITGKKKEEMTGNERIDYAKFIDRLYISFGDKLINYCSSRELTAIVLHELGHLYAHTSNFPNIIGGIIKWVLGTNIIKTLIVLPFLGYAYVPAITVTLSLVALLTTRSLTMLDHLGELHSDLYALKYGYGDEITKLLYSFLKVKEKSDKQLSWYKRWWNIISEIVFPSAHPPDSKRICNIAQQLKTDYAEQYPKFKKELAVIWSDIKCDSPMTKIKHNILTV